jgi:SAM-dependent methyltransferase
LSDYPKPGPGRQVPAADFDGKFDVTKDDPLRVQYEAYPYPPRDPADEKSRLITGSPSHIAEINHYLFAGRRDFSTPFRALIAGGGTGDAAIMLAQQLADEDAAGEVTYLDLSQSSAEIAQARARARGLGNINFIRGSILDLDNLVTGTFDYIDCCGVLHHMEDPVSGLRALEGVLADDGGMGLMVYAPFGRTGVYQMQSLLRMIGGDDPPTDRMDQAKAILNQLPPTNWLRRNNLVADHMMAGDAGLYDLLLHSRDRAYTVPDLARLVADADLRIVSFIEPIRYDPTAFIGDPALLEKIDRLSWIDQCALSELLTGNLKTHVFYVIKSGNRSRTVASAEDEDLRPVLIGLDPDTAPAALKSKGSLAVDFDGLKLSVPISEQAIDVLSLMDGHRTISAIRQATESDHRPMTRDEFNKTFSHLFAVLNGLNLGFLKY